MIYVATDFEGLRRAAVEYLEECVTADERERRWQKSHTAANRDELQQQLAPRRTLAEGYYARVGYLLDLQEMIEIGLQFRTADLKHKELAGLMAMRDARAEFEQRWPACGCGTRNIKLSPKCRGCGRELLPKTRTA